MCYGIISWVFMATTKMFLPDFEVTAIFITWVACMRSCVEIVHMESQ